MHFPTTLASITSKLSVSLFPSARPSADRSACAVSEPIASTSADADAGLPQALQVPIHPLLDPMPAITNSEATQAAIAAALTLAPIPNDYPPRKRGRPRKTADESGKPLVNKPILGPDGLKRGPGRPRKSEEQKAREKAEKLLKAIEEGGGIKKRGRPLGSKVRHV